jgi:hypothetical protein
MKPITWIKKLTTAALVAGMTTVGGMAQAGNVENMERERAILIDTMLTADLSPAERQSQIERSTRRLVDLERLVLRDDTLIGRNTPVVRRAFGNYDLTFLVHSSTEAGMSIMDTWLDQMGLSSQALMAADRKRR